jgi:hypothetical protein
MSGVRAGADLARNFLRVPRPAIAGVGPAGFFELVIVVTA